MSVRCTALLLFLGFNTMNGLSSRTLLMDSKDKRKLSEIDICDLFITQAIKYSGRDSMTQIRREVTLAPGLVAVRGKISARNKQKRFADYVLRWEPGVPIAVIEAKVKPRSILSRESYD